MFSERRPEAGIFVITLALMLLSVMTMIGFAVDTGNLYKGRIIAQKAVDAAAIGGAIQLARLNEREQNESGLLLNVTRLAADIASRNLPAGLFIDQSVVVVPDMTRNPPIVTMTLTGKVKLLLLGMPFLGMAASPIKVEAAAQIEPALIALTFDLSNSMRCQDGNNCTCWGPPDTCDKANSKITKLVAAAKRFVDKFDSRRDMISLVVFDRRARILKYAEPGGGFNRGEIENILDGLWDITAGDMTNPCDAIYAANESIKTAAAAKPTAQRSIILFSDGAPTAVRLDLADAKPALPLNPDPPDGRWQRYDYYFWDLKWSILDNAAGAYTHGVSQLSTANGAYPGIEPAAAPAYCPQYGEGGACSPPACSTLTWAGAAEVEDAQSELYTCVNSLKFRTPDDARWPYVSGNAGFRAGFKETFYLCPIAASDWVREKQQAVIYALGAGLKPGTSPVASTEPEPGGIKCSDDVFQELYRDDTRKDCFLRRLALPITASHPARANDFQDFVGVKPYAALNADDNHAKGLYIPMRDLSRIQETFDAVAAKIKSRLVR